MQKHLYFICPTDHLEATINRVSKQEVYYYTSLGNSVTLDVDTVRRIKELIVIKNIEKISFVLSYDNSVLIDAMKRQHSPEIKGLNDFYNRITKQKDHVKTLWQTPNNQHLILSYYLKNKIDQLRKSLLIDQLNISGKIYDRRKNIFNDIYADLLCLESFNLN